MKIELEKVIGGVVLLAGIVYGYGELNNKVDNLQEYNDTEIRKLADDNMNAIIEIKTKMDLLVTQDEMRQININKVAIENLKNRPVKLPRDFREKFKEMEEGMDELFQIVDEEHGDK